MFCPWSAITPTRSPISPRASTSRMTTTCGRKRVHIASITNTPAARAASNTCSASAALTVKAFSTSTCLPAAIASRACSRCSECGEATYTTSTSGSATSAS